MLLIMVLNYGCWAIQPLLNYSQHPQIIYSFPTGASDPDRPYILAGHSNTPGGHQSVYNTTPDYIAFTPTGLFPSSAAEVQASVSLYSGGANGFLGEVRDTVILFLCTT